MRKLVVLTAIFILCGMAFFTACSDKSADNDMTEGDYNSEEFVLTRQDADSTVSEMNFDDEEVGDWVLWNPGGHQDSVGYDSTTGWHVRARIFEGDYLDISVVDSFRFTDLGGTYQFRPDSTTNEFERRLKKYFLLTPHPDSQGTFWLKSRNRNTHWVGLTDSVTTLNGDFLRHWNGQSEYRNFERTVTGDLNDIQFYTDDIFDGRPTQPISGEFVGSIVQDVQTPYRQVHLEGSLTITFYMENGLHCYHARLERGNNWWEWDYCFPSRP